MNKKFLKALNKKTLFHRQQYKAVTSDQLIKDKQSGFSLHERRVFNLWAQNSEDTVEPTFSRTFEHFYNSYNFAHNFIGNCIVYLHTDDSRMRNEITLSIMLTFHSFLKNLLFMHFFLLKYVIFWRSFLVWQREKYLSFFLVLYTQNLPVVMINLFLAFHFYKNKSGKYSQIFLLFEKWQS